MDEYKVMKDCFVREGDMQFLIQFKHCIANDWQLTLLYDLINWKIFFSSLAKQFFFAAYVFYIHTFNKFVYLWWQLEVVSEIHEFTNIWLLKSLWIIYSWTDADFIIFFKTRFNLTQKNWDATSSSCSRE
jgi:hypothetical protein